MRTILDETELECPETSLRRDYLRSLSDHRVLINCASGEGLLRADGEDWPHPAYVTRRKEFEAPVTVERWTAYGDSGHKPKEVKKGKAANTLAGIDG